MILTNAGLSDTLTVLLAVLTPILVALIGLAGIIVTVRFQARVLANQAEHSAKLDVVKTEVVANNGLTNAELAERVEGRHIEATIPEAQRSNSEQAYVDVAHAPTYGSRPPHRH